MKIGILNSGGDCPGLNAVIQGVVGAATQLGWEVLGFHDGFEGLLQPNAYTILDEKNTFGICKLGGTILGTTNKGNFISKVGVSHVAEVPQEVVDRAKQTIEDLGVEGLIVVGGDGSLTTAQQLYRQGWPIIGVPKTIDNDLSATDMTFGFDSAVTSVVDALDRLHTTADSHKRIFVLEVMGRHTGWIALHGGLAGSADVILVPEIPFDIKVVAKHIQNLEGKGRRSALVVVSEGAVSESGDLVCRINQHGGEVRLGGIGEKVAADLEKLTGKDIRTCVLGHLQRGGSPTAYDRILSIRFGAAAVELIQNKQFGYMISFQSNKMVSVLISDAVNELRNIDPQSQIIHAAKAIGICFGDH